LDHAASLNDLLGEWAQVDHDRLAIALTVSAIAATAADLARLIAGGALEGALGVEVGDNADGDRQKALDIRADEMLLEALARVPVAVVGSEEQKAPVIFDPSRPLAVAIDPLDGSSNIDTNISVGTIFSLLPAGNRPNGDLGAALLQPGSAQVAAGFVVYGPQTSLVLTLGDGTDIYTLDPKERRFRRTHAGMQISPDGNEYAINASNYRHWHEPVRAYVDDCVAGADGPRGKNFNMRWIASLVAEAYRILIRGGIFLYPADRREGYGKGRLRLVYEANPLAMLIEQAGGRATDGENRILDLKPHDLHQRIPLVFGSARKVERVAAFHNGGLPLGERSPLFGRRGLFRQ
jgi:fructose-1,6-bisphosphatase I